VPPRIVVPYSCCDMLCMALTALRSGEGGEDLNWVSFATLHCICSVLSLHRVRRAGGSDATLQVEKTQLMLVIID